MRKHIAVIVSALSLLLISSCGDGKASITDPISSPETVYPFSGDPVSDDGLFTSHEIPQSISVSSEVIDNSIVSSDDSSLSSESSVNPDKPETVTVFAVNDVHGSLDKTDYASEPGLARLDYAIKHDADYDPETSFLVSSGDNWQGGYIAAQEKTLTDEIFSEMGIKASCVGNHEFDWGVDVMTDTISKSDIPYLACNIITGGKVVDWAEPSMELTISDVKYGIIGAIGPDQTSSIASDIISGYLFSDSMSLISKEVTKLEDDGCDIIFLLLHDGSDSDYAGAIGDYFTTDQIAGIFGGHTHMSENTTVGKNDIPFVQGWCNTKGYTKMTFDVSSGKAIDHSYVSTSSYMDIDDALLDSVILDKISEANQKYQADDALCTFQGEFRRYKELDKFLPECLVNKASDLGWGDGDNDLIGIVNEAGIRSNIPSGTATKKILFKTLPFDNEVRVIENVKGSQLAKMMGTINSKNQSKYYAYMTEDDTTFDSTKTYDVVTIDYVSTGVYWTKNITSSTQHQITEKDESTDDPLYILDLVTECVSDTPGKVYSAADYY